MFKKIYSLQQKICEFKRRSYDTGLTVFMVHHVSKDPRNEEMNLSIRTTEFKTIINELTDAGYQFVRPSQLEESFKSGRSEINICNSISEYELRNMIYVAKCIINSALQRKESVGAHYRSDSPCENLSPQAENLEEVNNESKIIA